MSMMVDVGRSGVSVPIPIGIPVVHTTILSDGSITFFMMPRRWRMVAFAIEIFRILFPVVIVILNRLPPLGKCRIAPLGSFDGMYRFGLILGRQERRRLSTDHATRCSCRTRAGSAAIFFRIVVVPGSRASSFGLSRTIGE